MAGGSVRIFSTSLDVEDIPFVRSDCVKLTIVCDKTLEVIGIGDTLKIAAENGFRFVVLSDSDSFKTLVARGDVNVAAEEIHEVGALEEQLRHPSIVVVGGGDMAVAALFGFSGADGVRNEGTESLAGKTFRGDGLLLIVKPIAIGVLRADEYGAGGASRGDAVSGDGAIDAEEIGVVAEDLKIVGGVIARGQTFVVEHGAAGVGGHLQMATEAGGSPGRVAGIAGH